MKRSARSFISFTRTERAGIFALCALLLVLIGVRVAMPYLARNEAPGDDRKLNEAWNDFKQKQKDRADSVAATKNDFVDRTDENIVPLPDMININTADSATLVRLKGIGPATAARIIEYRNRKGPYKSVSGIRDVAPIPDAAFKLLEKHLTVK